jgi:hypothetical protein
MTVGYVCGSVATGWISLSGHIKSDDLEEEGHPGRPYWGFCVRQYHSVTKKFFADKNSKIASSGADK